MKKRVTGLGGFFFKTKNPTKLKTGTKPIWAYLQIATDGHFGGKTKRATIVQLSGAPCKRTRLIFSPVKSSS